ncbi:MAG: DUF6544 family protein [Candidatus Nanopelagicales bacterium]
MPDARLLAGAAALFGVGAAGLGVPAPVPRRAATPVEPVTESPDPQWPDLLHQWLETAHQGRVPVAATCEFVGTGRIRLGRSPWLPVSYRTSHLLGQEFVAEVAATWFGRPVVRGMDAFVDRTGLQRARDTVTLGPGLDSDGVSFLWSEAALVPASWALPGVKWTQTDDTTLILDVAGPDVAAPVTATIACDGETGLPQTFTVPWRSKNPEGTVGAGWQVRYGGWRPADDGWAPALVEVQWLDEDRPWFRMRMEPPVLGADVMPALDQARAILRSAV